MSNQIVISSGAKVRNLDGVLTGTSGVVGSVPLGAANGVATLDSGGKVPVSQLPSSVVTYLGTWNAATNTPTLTNGTGDAGDMYICNVAGTVNFGAGPITFAVGDWVLYGSGTWQKSNGQNGTVTSVAVTESGDALSITGSPITTAGTINIGFAGTGSQYINGEGNLTTFPSLITEAQTLVTEVYNSTGVTLTKGTIVYINGGQGNLPTVTKAIATSDATSAQTYGVVKSDITNNNNGYVIVIGSLGDLDTQAYINGTQLYLSGTTAGAWTSTKPSAPIHLVYVGIVVRSHPTQGVVEIKIQNGYELDELHDVSITSVADNNILQYNSATSLWENVAGTTTNIAEGTNQYFTNARARSAISLTTSGTSGVATYNSTTGILNIPNYSESTFGTVTSVAMTVPTGLSVTGSPITTSGTLAVSLASGYSIPTTAKQTQWDTAYTNRITSASFPLSISSNAISISLASASTAGYLSIADWNTFNGKQNALTNPVTGTGNSGYVSIFTGTSTIGNSIIFQSTTRIGIMTATPSTTLDVNGGGNFSGSIGALSFVKSGGTSSQFLKADGSVDSNTYISSLSASSPLFYNSGTGVISISAATGSTNGYLSSTDWLTFSAKQDAITLTTTGTSGAATLVGSTLNIPQYETGITDLNGLTALSQYFATGTSGTDFSIVSDSNIHTFNLPTASDTNRGLLSSADWTTFNNKQNALTNPVTGTGTTNTLPKFTAASTIGDSNITDSGSLITLGSNSYISSGGLGIGTTSLTNYGIRISKNITGAASGYGVSIEGTIQSDVTTARFYYSAPTTQATAYTLANLQHYVAGTTTIGAGSSITNQFGFLVLATASGATNNYAFNGQLAAATNTWNLYMVGTANNYLAGSLGIGSTSLTGFNLLVSKNITGSTTSYGIHSNGQIQSDVTATAYMYRSLASTSAASFTLGDLIHFNAGQGTFGAGSTVNTQYGFNVSSSLIGATTNYGFFGNIPAAIGRWNLFMNGTADNYLAGNVGIGVSGDLVSSGPILTTTLTNGGSGYVDGTYTDIASSNISASGNYALFTVVISAGIVTSATLTWGGYGYKVGETLTISNTLLGGTGSGLIITVDTVDSSQLTIANANGGDITLFRNDTSLSAGENIGTIKWVGRDNSSKASGIYAEIGAFAAGTSGGAVLSFFTRSITAGTSLVEAMRIDSRGGVGIGATILTGYSLRVSKNITGSTISYGIMSDGIIQSDVTNQPHYFSTNAQTAAATFTTNTLLHYRAIQGTFGAGSTVTNQVGFWVDNTLIGATNNYGFYGNIAALGSSRWNLFMNGTANNYMAGSLGIGSTSLTQFNLRISKNITGSTTSYSISNEGVIQSDAVTAMYNATSASTAAASFTLTNLRHYFAQQGTFGAGSTVTNQYGFQVESNLIGATNNYGFFGNIASGTNRWNLYMNGTANNYMAGSLGIGSTSLTLYSLRVSKNITGGTQAYGIVEDGQIQSDVTNAGNYFVSSASTAAASFTLTSLFHFRASQSTFGAGSTVTTQIGFSAEANMVGGGTNYGFKGSIPSGTNRWNLYMDGTASNYLAGKLLIGSTTDSGEQLQVTGTAKITGAATFSSSVTTGLYGTTAGAKANSGLIVYNNTAINTYSQIGLGYDGGTYLPSYIGMIVTNYSNYSYGDIVLGTRSVNTDTQPSERMRITSGGNVGIGTSSPTSLLNLYSSDSTPLLTIRSTSGNSGATGLRFSIADNTVTTDLYAKGGIFYVGEGTTGARGAIVFANNSDAGSGNVTTANERMRITSGGNVLIGTTTDSGYKLDVNGTARISGLVVSYNTFNTQTASYTLVLADASKIVETNVSTANTVTVPTNASVPFPIGTEITIMQYGGGVTTIASASGVTINSKSNARIIANRYTGATLVKRGTDEWYLIGNIVP